MQGTVLPENFKSIFIYPPSWGPMRVRSTCRAQRQLMALAIAPLDGQEPVHRLCRTTSHLGHPSPPRIAGFKQHGDEPHEHLLALEPGLDRRNGRHTPLKAQDKVMFRADRQAIDADRQRAIPDDEAAGAVGQITNLNIGALCMVASCASKPGSIGHQGEQNDQHHGQVDDFA